MTSKISYHKLIGYDIRHRGWLAALNAVVLFLGMPIFTWLYLDGTLENAGAASATAQVAAENMRWAREVFPSFLNGNMLNLMAAAILAFAVLAALTGFGYLHSREQLDFYHGLPVRRGQWFAVRWLSGILVFLVPYAVCAGLTVAVGAANGIMTRHAAVESACAAAGAILAYMVIYHTTILASVLTGQTVTGLLAAVAIAVYPTLVFSLPSYLKGTFFAAYTGTEAALSDVLKELASPIGLFNRLTLGLRGADADAAVFLAAVAAAVILLAAAFAVYRIYPSESAGNPLAFPRTAAVIKVLVCIPAAVFSCFFIKSFMGIQGTKWILALSLLAAVLICAVIEFIYQQDLRMLLKGWRSSLISVAGVFILFSVYQFDLFGYDTWLPEEEKVESVSFRPESFWGYFKYIDTLSPDSGDMNRTGYAGSESESGKALLLELARAGISGLDQGITPEALDYSSAGSEMAEGYINTLFCYKMKSGREVVRRYCLERESVLSALERLSEDEEFRRELFPVFQADEDQISAVRIRDIYGMAEDLKLDKEQRKALIEAYKKDVMEVEMKTLAEETPIGELLLDYPDGSTVYTREGGITVRADSLDTETGRPNVVTAEGFYLYKGYANTLACLEEYGYTIREQIDPADVNSITLNLSGESLQKGRFADLLSQLSSAEEIPYDDGSGEFAGREITVRSREDVSAVLEHLVLFNEGILGNGWSMADYADIDFNSGSGVYSYQLR